jgi:hypothetical protein
LGFPFALVVQLVLSSTEYVPVPHCFVFNPPFLLNIVLAGLKKLAKIDPAIFIPILELANWVQCIWC